LNPAFLLSFPFCFLFSPAPFSPLSLFLPYVFLFFFSLSYLGFFFFVNNVCTYRLQSRSKYLSSLFFASLRISSTHFFSPYFPVIFHPTPICNITAPDSVTLRSPTARLCRHAYLLSLSSPYSQLPSHVPCYLRSSFSFTFLKLRVGRLAEFSAVSTFLLLPVFFSFVLFVGVFSRSFPTPTGFSYHASKSDTGPRRKSRCFPLSALFHKFAISCHLSLLLVFDARPNFLTVLLSFFASSPPFFFPHLFLPFLFVHVT